MHQEILLGGSGQAFYVELIERPRRPASVEVTSWSSITHAATTSCEIDPFETMLAEPAPVGATILHLEATEGITPGTRYTIARHGVVVIAVEGTHVTLRRPLPLAVGASELFLGCRISAPIDATWASAVANVTEHLDVEAGYILTWTYHQHDGARTTARTTADLVRTAQLARVTPDDVETRFPGWLAMVERPQSVIDEAFDIVRRDARLHRSIRRARHAFALRELVIAAANVVAIEQVVLFEGAAKAMLAHAEERYRALLTELVRRASGDAAPHQPQAQQQPRNDQKPLLGVAHVNVIDALMEWVGRNPLVSAETILEMEDLFLPRLRTPEERRIASMFLLAQELPTKPLRELLRYRVLAYLK